MLVHDTAAYMDTQMKQLRGGLATALGADFDAIYTYLLSARTQQVSNEAIKAYLTQNYPGQLEACLQVDYLVCLECFGPVDIVMYQ